MSPYNWTRSTYTTDVYTTTGQNVYPPTWKQSFKRQLSGIASSSGNYVDPRPHAFVLEESISGVGSLRYTYPVAPANNRLISGLVLNPPTGSANDPVLLNNAYNQALSKLADSVRSGADVSVDAFQLGQVKRMISATVRLEGIAQNFNRVFRSRRYSGKSNARWLGSKWLELQYGWLPLLGTIYDCAENLVDPTGRILQRSYKARGRILRTTAYDDGTTVKGTQAWSYGVEVGVTLAPATTRLQELSRFTSLNPLSVAWELLPYSFIADWFFNVGGYLRTAETALLHNSRFVRGYRSDIRVFRGTYDLTIRNPTPGTLVRDGSCNTVSYRHVIFNRSVLASYPLPRYPSINASLGSGRLLNAAALLSQLLK